MSSDRYATAEFLRSRVLPRFYGHFKEALLGKRSVYVEEKKVQSRVQQWCTTGQG